MMHRRKLIPFLSLLLLLAGGLGILMIERANAVCSPWPKCCWQGIVAGTVTVTNPKAHITTAKLDGKKEQSLDVDVSQEMLDIFKNEPDGSLIGIPVSGFIILKGETMTGFVPITREHKEDDTFGKINVQQAIKAYHDEFEKLVESRSGNDMQKQKP